jgi:hypothetical protein
MKKTVVLFLIISFLTFTQLIGQEKKADESKKDPLENFVMVEKTQPVPENLKTGFDSINGKDAMNHLKFLSSDALEGRETGSNGYQVAAEYVATMFAIWGLKPAGDMPPPPSRRSFFSQRRTTSKSTRSYLQNVELKEYLESEGSAHAAWREGNKLKSKSFIQDVDYQYRSRESQILSAPVVFVGYGISEKSLKFDEYKGVDVKGKIVMMLSEYPGKGDPDSPFVKGKLKEKYDPPRSPFRRRSRFSSNPKTKLAKEKGAVAIIMVENSPQKNGDVAKRVLDSQRINDERPIFPGKRRQFSLLQSWQGMPFATLPTVRVSRQMAEEILKLSNQNLDSLKQKIGKNLKPSSMELKGVTFTVKSKVRTKLVRSPNVLGYIEGSDPELKKEVIVIGGHLDHLGKRGEYIFNGADDNGSGSVGVMEVAEAFALNPEKPKRSILFALWTGEEKGLLGSRYYVSNPYFPIDKTVANINLDMLSREWDKQRLQMMSRFMGIKLPDEKQKKIDTSNFISLSFDANSPDIKTILKENNQYVGLTIMLRPTKSIMRGGGGSDHMPFAMKKIHWAFFMAGMTEDYHQPSDTIDKVSEKLMKSITRLVYLTAFSLANK